MELDLGLPAGRPVIAAGRLLTTRHVVNRGLRLSLVTVWAFLVQAAPLQGQQHSDVADSLGYWKAGGWLDPEDADRIIEDLESSGAVLTSEDLLRLGLSEPSPPPESAKDDSFELKKPTPPLWKGQATLRVVWRPSEPGSQVARLRLEGHGLRGSAHCRADADGRRQARGTVEWRSQSWHVAAGGIGLQHGLGLWCASPGRWSSLTASAPFTQGRQGPVAYIGMEDRHALWGFAQALRSRFGRLTSLVGRPQMTARDADPIQTRAIGAAVNIGSVEVSGLASRVGSTTGGSFAVAATSEWSALNLESARWRSAKGPDLQTAWAATVRIGRRAWALEAQMAGAAAGEGCPLGMRPAVLPGWHGKGWGLRGRMALDSSTRLRWLLARGEKREMAGGYPRIRFTTALEIALERRLRPGWRGEVRCRVGQYEDRGWVDRLPWLAPEPFNARRRVQYVGLLCYRRSDSQVQVSARRMIEIRDDPAPEMAIQQDRNLVTARADWLGWTGWRLRIAWNWAWGDDIDLVSVAAPAFSIVVPRHWGKWRGEWSLGCQYSHSLGAIQIGIVRRMPAVNLSAVPQLELLARWLVIW